MHSKPLASRMWRHFASKQFSAATATIKTSRLPPGLELRCWAAVQVAMARYAIYICIEIYIYVREECRMCVWHARKAWQHFYLNRVCEWLQYHDKKTLRNFWGGWLKNKNNPKQNIRQPNKSDSASRDPRPCKWSQHYTGSFYGIPPHAWTNGAAGLHPSALIY